MEVEYEWNTFRMARGVKKVSKNKNKGTFTTCSTGDTVEELNKKSYLLSCIKNKIKSSQGVEINITGWKWREKMGISNDVY